MSTILLNKEQLKPLSIEDIIGADTKQDTLIPGANITIDENNVISSTGGSGGSSNYNDLLNKPQINSTTLSGNILSSDLGLVDLNTFEDHTNNIGNPHQVTKQQVGLSNVDNTSDLDKPVSTATSNLLASKADSSDVYLKTETYSSPQIDSFLAGKVDKDTIYTNSEIDILLESKQPVLTAGTNITISDNTISSSGGIEDAPSNDNVYGRSKGTWVNIQHTDIIDDTSISQSTTYSSNKIETRITEAITIPSLQQVLTKGNSSTTGINITNSNIVVSDNSIISTISPSSISVVDSTGDLNSYMQAGSIFVSKFNTDVGDLESITISVADGIKDIGNSVLSANSHRNITDSEATTMRNKLKIIDDTQYSLNQTYSSTFINTSFENINSRIEAVEGLGGFLPMHDFGTSTLSQQDLTDYALESIGITDSSKIFNGTRVENTFDNTVWILANTPDTVPPVFEWIRGSNSSVSTATNSSLGIVKGSSDNLKVGILPDGSMQTNGISTALDSKLSIANLYAGSNISIDVEGNNVTINSTGGTSGGTVDLSNYYTKAQSNNRFGLKTYEHSHANKIILDLFSVDGGVLKYNGNAIPINPAQIDTNVSGTYNDSTIFTYSTICSSNSIKAIITSYLFMSNTLQPTPDLEEGEDDPNNATIDVYNVNYKLETIVLAPQSTQTYQVPSSMGIVVKATGTVDCQATINGYVY